MKNVVFQSDIYRVTAIDDTATKELPVYQTLAGYKRMRDADLVEMEMEASVLKTFSGLGVETPCRAKTVKTYYVTHTFQKQTTVNIIMPESVERITIKPDSAASKVKISGNCVTVNTDETLYFIIQPDDDIFGGNAQICFQSVPNSVTEGGAEIENVHSDEQGSVGSVANCNAGGVKRKIDVVGGAQKVAAVASKGNGIVWGDINGCIACRKAFLVDLLGQSRLL